MSDVEKEKLLKAVNQSGFPLQLALEALVRQSGLGWKVHLVEHGWSLPQYDASGFADLVLVDSYGTSFINIECKRVQDANWIFIVAEEKQLRRSHAKAHAVRYRGDKMMWNIWEDVVASPVTAESSFCVIPGHDSKGRQLIEHSGSILVSSTEAIALEEMRLSGNRNDAMRVFFSMIVTTARLHSCRFDPETVSLRDGTIAENAEIVEIPFLRFRKQLSNANAYAHSTIWDTASDMSKAYERTIFVVQAMHFIKFLSQFEIDERSFNQLAAK